MHSITFITNLITFVLKYLPCTDTELLRCIEEIARENKMLNAPDFVIFNSISSIEPYP